MILIKALVQRIIISVISFYVPQCGLDDIQKYMFHDSVINIVRTLRGKEIFVIAVDFNGHSGHNAKDFKDHHGGYGYGVSIKKGARILEFCAAMNIRVGNKLFKERSSHIVTYEHGPPKTMVD